MSDSILYSTTLNYSSNSIVITGVDIELPPTCLNCLITFNNVKVAWSSFYLDTDNKELNITLAESTSLELNSSIEIKLVTTI